MNALGFNNREYGCTDQGDADVLRRQQALYSLPVDGARV